MIISSSGAWRRAVQWCLLTFWAVGIHQSQLLLSLQAQAAPKIKVLPTAPSKPPMIPVGASSTTLNQQLQTVLQQQGFTGTIEQSVPQRLGRPIDFLLFEVGHQLFFDTVLSLHGDNGCVGCHSPNNGYGDTQPIAIGVDNNFIVGRLRAGPRNQRRAPGMLNTAMYPKLMWNGRFNAPSGNSFDNSQGYAFPAPEGTTRFPAYDTSFYHLLVGQAHLPQSDLAEMAGFTGLKTGTYSYANSNFQVTSSNSIRYKLQLPFKITTFTSSDPKRPLVLAKPKLGSTVPDYSIFDNGKGQSLPTADSTGTRNEPIRDKILTRLNSIQAYRDAFGAIYPSVAGGGPITQTMVGQAIAEFEILFTFTDAPLDKFARGDAAAMTDSQKRGALLFFGKAKCAQCHTVGGSSNEMFSDFQFHNLAVPQVAPKFGVGTGNVAFRDASGAFSTKGNQDCGLEDVTANSADRYKFRTSPLRNMAVAGWFFHNGAYKRLEDCIAHHLDPITWARRYRPALAGLPPDLAFNMGPIEPVIAKIDPLVKTRIFLTPGEFIDLVEFVRNGLTDDRARPDFLQQGLPPNGKAMSGDTLPTFTE